MVKGLDIFRERFRNFTDCYMLIGGAACEQAMNHVGLVFRATRDLDIVLCIEALDIAFVQAFWQFVCDGDYQIRQKADGGRQFYRFQRPADTNYPSMLELFSRSPDGLELPEDGHLTPIPTAEEVSSLSAILMDDHYYHFICSMTTEINGLRIVCAEGLIPLKARAWLDLTERRAAGQAVQSGDITKHKKDVFRLYQVVDPEAMLDIPEAIKTDMAAFIEQMSPEQIDPRAIGILTFDLETMLGGLRELYCIDE
jgi:hypothetical protein